MYQSGDKVIYSLHGACRVVETEERLVDRKRIKYLVLEQVDQSGCRYYIPTHNSAAMAKLKKMLTKTELTELLGSDSVRVDCWIRDENARKQSYRELITSGDRQRLLEMVYTLYMHIKTQTAAGRKVHQCDENFLRDAERVLCSEICAVMEIEPDQAKNLLRRSLAE